jgi:hypothetical protein
VFTAVAIAFAVACGSGDGTPPSAPPPTLPAAPVIGAGIVSAALTGFGDSAKPMSWANASATKDSTGLYFRTGDARLSVFLKGASAAGNFSLGARESFVEYVLFPNPPANVYSTFGNVGTTGSIQLIALSAHRATGFFSFSTPAKNDGRSETAAFAISNGYFDVAFP